MKMSPPMRGRGLKQGGRDHRNIIRMSPPMRGRGLKLGTLILAFFERYVAPHAGAWIETKV